MVNAADTDNSDNSDSDDNNIYSKPKKPKKSLYLKSKHKKSSPRYKPYSHYSTVKPSNTSSSSLKNKLTPFTLTSTHTNISDNQKTKK